MMTNKTTVVILGSTGMLGYACAKFFVDNPRYTTLLSCRSTKFMPSDYVRHSFHFDAANENALDDVPMCDYVINCIGIIPHHNKSRDELYELNASFVHRLVDRYKNSDTRVIHISTDSVFSGKHGMYVESSRPDPVNDYGRSKLDGESDAMMCLRTSTIGYELHGHVCLLEWMKRQAREKQRVNGYLNQYWNGLTADEYARMCDRIMTNDLYVNGIRHIYANVMSKFELMTLLNKKYDFDLRIEPVFLENKIDRTLVSEFDTSRKLAIPSIEEMVERL